MNATNYIIRPARLEDLEAITRLAGQTGVGMTSLSTDPEIMLSKIQLSIKSFSKEENADHSKDYYLFVLENLEDSRVYGSSACRSQIGVSTPSYSYEIKYAKHNYRDISKEIPYLQLHEERNGPSIISSLFVDLSARAIGAGKTLSLTRFLFMAEHPLRLQNQVIAELVGYVTPEKTNIAAGQSPFWEHIIKPFFDMEFSYADQLSLTDKSFIASLMPKHPLYIPLLDTSVQPIIGEVRADTIPALKMLEAEGFKKDGHVDIFDAGPRVSALTSSILTIKNSQRYRVTIDDKANRNISKLVTNVYQSDKFRAKMIQCEIQEDNIIISQADSIVFYVNEGDYLRA